MITQLIEFMSHHAALTAAFFVLLAAWGFLEWRNHRHGLRAVSAQDAVHLINREGARIIDMSSKQAFDAGHLAAALSKPFDGDVKAYQKDLEIELHSKGNQKKPVLLVCATGQSSRMMGERLRQAGFKEITVLAGGMAAWNAAQLPTVKRGKNGK